MWPYNARPNHTFVTLTNRTAVNAYRQEAQIVPLSSGPMYAFSVPFCMPVVRAGVGCRNSRAPAPDKHVQLTGFLHAAHHKTRILDGFAGVDA